VCLTCHPREPVLTDVSPSPSRPALALVGPACRARESGHPGKPPSGLTAGSGRGGKQALHRRGILTEDAPAPLGPTRLLLSKPVLAAVEGHAVAGGLELALWCDLRIAAVDAAFGVFCRRFGVPLLDLGTVRLPRLIEHSHAMDLILHEAQQDCHERPPPDGQRLTPYCAPSLVSSVVAGRDGNASRTGGPNDASRPWAETVRSAVRAVRLGLSLAIARVMEFSSRRQGV
jgi:hypothetical protein